MARSHPGWRRQRRLLADDCAIAGHQSSHHRRDLPHLLHQLVKLFRVQRLDAIGQGLVGVVVDFDDQSVRANRNRRARQRSNFVPFSSAVAWIDHDGQMAEPLHRRHQAKIKRVAGVVGKGPHPAFTQDHFIIALAHDILGRHQKFFQRGRHAAFEQDRDFRVARHV